MVRFTLNGEQRELDVDADMPLLWVLRDELGLTGTKFGCGMGLCGACTIHLDGAATRSCILPVSTVEGREVATIESLAGAHPLQAAWVKYNVPQCGYCQSGQIMSAAALLAENPAPDRDAIRSAMAGNLCRCGTYSRIEQAIASVAETATPVAAVQSYDPAEQGTE